ncbi:hypothetical protein GFC29_3867 (plasmid) [Anoxybacillus sp. B7M1]|uniref:hypothetical protein n=1 Tax=Anoxybacillus sp. B7M1 TaxID=1490057 RepID=UPI0007B5A0DE|nr:hypothetical protein GFC29_3867 [Anoxybacillus sp. B7M1]
MMEMKLQFSTKQDTQLIVPDDVEQTEDEERALLLHELSKINEYEDAVEKYRKIAQAGIAQWVKDFKSGHIKISSVDDLEKLIKIDLMLQKQKI